MGVEFLLGHKAVAGAWKGWEWVVFRRGGFPFSKSPLLIYFLLPQALRKLNSVSVPKMVSVPKNDEEDAKRGNQ